MKLRIFMIASILVGSQAAFANQIQSTSCLCQYNSHSQEGSLTAIYTNSVSGELETQSLIRYHDQNGLSDCKRDVRQLVTAGTCPANSIQPPICQLSVGRDSVGSQGRIVKDGVLVLEMSGPRSIERVTEAFNRMLRSGECTL